jgi:osmotically inducible protein OsmC
MNILYTAHALSTGGGRDGHTRSDDGQVDLDLALPTEMGGTGKGANPEQLFAAGYSACFHSALYVVAGQEGIKLKDTSVSAAVGIGPNGNGGFELQVALGITLPGVDHAQATDLVNKTHQVCPYSNATRGNVDVKLTVEDNR